jgi:hypothetical protein
MQGFWNKFEGSIFTVPWMGQNIVERQDEKRFFYEKHQTKFSLTLEEI